MSTYYTCLPWPVLEKKNSGFFEDLFLNLRASLTGQQDISWKNMAPIYRSIKWLPNCKILGDPLFSWIPGPRYQIIVILIIILF